MDEALWIFYVRASRVKARTAATAEALSLLRDLAPQAPVGGPLADQRGIFWITLPTSNADQARARLPRLGYTCAVDALAAIEAVSENGAEAEAARTVRWKRRAYRLVPVYREDEAALRAEAPDQRVFLLETGDRVVRVVRGYRGDSGPLSRRGLPVPDARLLVNLVASAGAVFLDPFAGAGGIIVAAQASGCRVLSSDCDPALRYGLAGQGARHCVAQAEALPFGTATIAAIATEPPYDVGAEATVRAALHELDRVLIPGGRLAIYCAADQAPGLRQEGQRLGLISFLDTPINRKGTDCVALAWQKSSDCLSCKNT